MIPSEHRDPTADECDRIISQEYWSSAVFLDHKNNIKIPEFTHFNQERRILQPRGLHNTNSSVACDIGKSLQDSGYSSLDDTLVSIFLRKNNIISTKYIVDGFTCSQSLRRLLDRFKAIQFIIHHTIDPPEILFGESFKLPATRRSTR